MSDASMRTAVSGKAEQRRAALAARDAIPMTARIEAALALAEHADALSVRPGDVAAAYWPIRSEIDPRPLHFALVERGCRAALPVVRDGALVFRQLLRTGTLEPAGFGTMGPGPEAAELTPDVVLLPLAAFDAAGNRLGYGKGHYDATIARLRAAGHAPRLFGLAYAAQRVEAIAAEAHDVPLDGVLTERGFVAFDARSSLGDMGEPA